VNPGSPGQSLSKANIDSNSLRQFTMNRVLCGNCGGKVNLPNGYTKAKIHCPHCGYYAEVPPEFRDQAPVAPEPQTPFDSPAPPAPAAVPVRGSQSRPSAERDPPRPPAESARPVKAKPAKRRFDLRDHRPDFTTDEPAGEPLLRGTQEEHDDDALPYTVPGDGVKKCEFCNGELPLDATFCVHCGTDLKTGEATTDRVYKVVNRFWEEGYSFELRLRVFIVLQFVNALFTVLTMIATKQSLSDLTALLTNLLGNLFHIGLQAFLLGSYDSILIRRNSRGAATLTRFRRIAFLKLAPQKIPWKASIATGVMATHQPGYVSWFVMVYLCTLGCLPGLVFYFVVIRPDRYLVALTDVYGHVEDVVFRTTSRERAEEVCEAVANATSLELRMNL
jgi:hypothetical protein